MNELGKRTEELEKELAIKTEQADVYRLRAERSEHRVEELESLMRARQVRNQ